MTSCLLSTVIHHSFQLYKKPFTALRLLKSRWKWLSEYTLPKESYQRAGVTALHHLCACGTEFHCPPCSWGHSRAYSRAPPWPFNTPGSGRWQTKASALLFLLQTRPGRTIELLTKSWDTTQIQQDEEPNWSSAARPPIYCVQTTARPDAHQPSSILPLRW